MTQRKPKPLPQAKIIAVYMQKGGCGKTSLTMQLGGTLALRGYRVLIVDMDSQDTAIIWTSQALEDKPFPATVISLSALGGKMVGELQKHQFNYDFILIDCPPAIGSVIPWAALNIADLGLIPIIPVMDNIWASKKAKELGQLAQEQNSELLLRYVPMMVRRGNLFDLCLSLLREDETIPVIEPGLRQRNIFGDSQALGVTVHGVDRRSPAVFEIENLTNSVLKTLGIGGR